MANQFGSSLQCACRWILRHQHKLKQAARSCHLKVKEAVVGNMDERQYDYEEYTFKVGGSRENKKKDFSCARLYLIETIMQLLMLT